MSHNIVYRKWCTFACLLELMLTLISYFKATLSLSMIDDQIGISGLKSS